MGQETRALSEHSLLYLRPGYGEAKKAGGLSSVWGNYCLAMPSSQLASQAALSSGESAMNHGQRVKDEGVWGRSTYPIPSYVQSSQ